MEYNTKGVNKGKKRLLPFDHDFIITWAFSTFMTSFTWQEHSLKLLTHPRDPNRLSNLPESPKSPHYNYKLVREL